jgi:hypothetical protein
MVPSGARRPTALPPSFAPGQPTRAGLALRPWPMLTGSLTLEFQKWLFTYRISAQYELQTSDPNSTPVQFTQHWVKT